MKIFDSIQNNKWIGKGIDFRNNSIIVLKSGKFSHQVSLKKGNYHVKVVGKKRTGSGKIWVSIVTDRGDIFLKESIEFTSSAWSEKNLGFEVPKHVGLAKIELYRDRHIYGSLELGRIIIESTGAEIDIIRESSKLESPLIVTKPSKQKKSEINVKQQKSNIAVVIPYQIFGGAEVYIGNLINQACSEYNFTLIYLKRNYLQNYIPSSRVQHRIVRDLEQLAGFLKTYNFNHIIYYNRLDIYQLLDKLKLNNEISSKLIEIYHSDFIWPGSLSSYKHRRSIDKFITVSESLGFDIENIEEQKRFTVPVSIDLNKFKANKSLDLRRELGFNPKDIIIGTVARLSVEKQIDHIINLAAILPNYKFVIVGDGPERNRLEKSIIEQKITNVKLVGHQNSIEKYYNIFDGFVLSSKIEGTPVSIIEAMACEVLVFSNMVGAIPDILKPGETGIAISGDPKVDAIIIKENLFNSKIIQNAKAYVLNKHDIVKNSNSLFKTIVSENNFFTEITETEKIIILSGEYI